MRLLLMLLALSFSTAVFSQKNAVRLLLPIEGKNTFGLQYERSLSPHFSLNYSIQRRAGSRIRNIFTIVPGADCGSGEPFSWGWPCQDEHIIALKQKGIIQAVDLRVYPEGNRLKGFHLEAGASLGFYESSTSADLKGWRQEGDLPTSFVRFFSADLPEFALAGKATSFGWHTGLGYQISLFKGLSLGLNLGFRWQIPIHTSGDQDAIYAEDQFDYRSHFWKGATAYGRVQLGFHF